MPTLGSLSHCSFNNSDNCCIVETFTCLFGTTRISQFIPLENKFSFSLDPCLQRSLVPKTNHLITLS